MRVVISQVAKAELKRISKKYKNILSDLNIFINDIKNQNLGDRIQGFPISIYKARIKNSSNNKGKSGGFRVIYHLKIEDTLYILSLYSKNEKGNVDKKNILLALKQLGFLV